MFVFDRDFLPFGELIPWKNISLRVRGDELILFDRHRGSARNPLLALHALVTERPEELRALQARALCTRRPSFHDGAPPLHDGSPLFDGPRARTLHTPPSRCCDGDARHRPASALAHPFFLSPSSSSPWPRRRARGVRHGLATRSQEGVERARWHLTYHRHGRGVAIAGAENRPSAGEALVHHLVQAGAVRQALARVTGGDASSVLRCTDERLRRLDRNDKQRAMQLLLPWPRVQKRVSATRSSARAQSSRAGPE